MWRGPSLGPAPTRKSQWKARSGTQDPRPQIGSPQCNVPRKAIKACQGKGQGALPLREWPCSPFSSTGSLCEFVLSQPQHLGHCRPVSTSLTHSHPWVSALAISFPRHPVATSSIACPVTPTLITLLPPMTPPLSPAF